MTDQFHVTAEFPDKLIYPLLESKDRYIVLYGGRAGMKSWNIARALLIRATQKRLRILCAREFRSSTRDSIWELLSDQIHLLGLQDLFKIEQGGIYGVNGSQFHLMGVRNNPTAVKSAEGVDILWLEEAANISKHSFEILDPTIRREGSQIFISFNPELETDFIYQFFVVNTPPDCCLVKTSYLDNPYFPPALRGQMEHMKRNDPDSYANIWLGYPRVFLDNAVFAKELRVMQEEKRITHVPYDPSTPVHTFWDLGFRDATSIIMAQKVGFEYHVIDFIQDNGKSITEYLSILQKRPYVWGTDYLPHDAKAKSLQTKRSIEEILRANGRKVHIVPRLTVRDGLEATRLMFPATFIDEKHCSDLVQSLRKYVWDMRDDYDPSSNRAPRLNKRPEPLHDGNSHAVDAFRYMALMLKGDPQRAAPTIDPFAEVWGHTAPARSWMA